MTEEAKKAVDSLPLPDEAIITIWYDEKDQKCTGDYVKVELDLFWDGFSHTREFGNAARDDGLIKAQTWALAYQILKPSFKATEVHRPMGLQPIEPEELGPSI